VPTAPAEQPATTATVAPPGGDAGAGAPVRDSLNRHANGSGRRGEARQRERWLAHVDAWLPTLLVAGVLCFVAFVAGGGLNLSDMTTVEIALTLSAGLVATAAVLLGPAGMRAYGA